MIDHRPLTVCMIGQKGAPNRPDAGGVERHVAELAPRLVARGMRVTAYVRTRFMGDGQSLGEGVTMVPVASINTKHLDAITYTFLASIRACAGDADVIHYHGVGPSLLAWIPRVFAPRKKVLVTFHSIDRHHQKWGWFARLSLRVGEWCAVRFPHRTIAVSRSIQRYCKEQFGADVAYVPNGAPIPNYPGSDLLAQFGISANNYILTVARLVKQKGIHHLIGAYDGFEPEKKLVIVGAGEETPGSYADQVRALAEGNSSIVFTGFQTGQALAQLFANAYLYVHPSEAEGLAISILEAMANSRCVLVSDIPENLESIDHSGLSFVNADADDLREKIRELLNHPEVVAQLGDRARQWIAHEYDWENIADNVAANYRALTKREKTA